MGSVKVDLKAGDMKYQETSFSSTEDVYDFLLRLDLIYDDSRNGNTEAICLYADFIRLLDSVENVTIVKMYHDIQLGLSPMTVDDYGLDILEVIVKRTNLPMKEIVFGLNREMDTIVEQNKVNWTNSININYKNTYLGALEENKEPKQNFGVNESENLRIDFMRKYIYPSTLYDKTDLPQDLEEMLTLQRNTKDKVKELQALVLKYKKKDNKRHNDFKTRLKQMTNFKIQIDKDVVLLKKHYNIPIESNNKKGKTSFMSYDLNNQEVLKGHQDVQREQILSSYDKIDSHIQVGKIKEIAEKTLTKKQLLIFNLYYFGEMTQQEIAGIIGDNQPNVKNDIKRILVKIRKNM